MNRNQEFAGLLINLIEISASTNASAARVLRGGLASVIEGTSPTAPRVTNGQLMMADVAALNMAVSALVTHLHTGIKAS